MLRIVLIATAGCVLLIAVLALTRGGEPRSAAREPAEIVTVERAPTKIAKAPTPETAAPVAVPEPELPAGQQMEDDAAAVGMTTREPQASDETPPEPQSPPSS